VNNEALRERLRLAPTTPGEATPAEPVDPAAWATSEPQPPADEGDRDIYDTARRIWQRFRQ
jgi:hypothetical protein